MSVASKNPFALLEDDGSAAPSSTAATKETSTPATAPARGTNRGRGGPASRGGKYYNRGGKPNAPRENQGGDVAEDAAGEAPKRRFDGEGRGRGRGRGRGDRGRGGRGRTYDRHSATGKTDSEKKIHQGWGGDEGKSELKAEAAGETDAQVEVSTGEGWGAPAASADAAWGAPTEPTEGWGAPPAENGAPAEGEKGEGRPRREREPEEEDNTLTLDQYLQQQKEKGLDIVPKLEARQANEGDDTIWKDAVAVTKKDEEEDAYFVGKTKNAPKARAKKEEKVYLEIDAHFDRPARGRGRGGDRGGDRGSDRGDRRGGRGRGTRGRGGTQALNVNDQAAFPSLS